MSIEEQYKVIRNMNFLTKIQTKATNITNKMGEENVRVEDGWLGFVIDGVNVRFKQLPTGDVELQVGKTDSNEPLYAWVAPQSWLTPTKKA